MLAVTEDKPRAQALAEAFTAELARNKPPLVLTAATQQAFKQMAERHRTMLAAFAQPAANSYARTVMAAMQPVLGAYLRDSRVFADVRKIAGLAAAGSEAVSLANAMPALSPPRTDWSNLIDAINKQPNRIDHLPPAPSRRSSR